MLVVDASVALPAALVEDGFARLGDDDLRAPQLMWSEAEAALHEAAWRGELASDAARAALDRLLASPIAPERPAGLAERAWAVADDFGWAKTYDAEYVALADLLRCRLVTADARLLRATSRLGYVVALTDV
jgi:predicted nucleic acid-binding protein